LSAIKVFGGITLSLFFFVGVAGAIKKNKQVKHAKLEHVVKAAESTNESLSYQEKYQEIEELPDYITAPIIEEPQLIEVKEEKIFEEPSQIAQEVDRVDRLFSKNKLKLPFIETITYKSRVSWLQGRPAWIADYANYFQTSRHFIARSLNGNRDYYTQKVASGDQFNVFSKSSDVRFHLVVDLTKLKLWFYAYDKVSNYRFLLKTYKCGCGKLDKDSSSGSLTPFGTFTLSDKVAIYRQGVEGFFKDQKVEMIQIFGTRWMPYTAELDDSAAMIKGFGIHGVPWFRDETSGELIEDRETIGRYDSSGCIRLLKEDVEEIFSIVITKPTTVEIVKNHPEAKLPGVEWIDPLDSQKE
jgi:hypothetical protein